MATVDEVDFPRLMGLSWYLHCGYARAYVDGKKVYMHRYILGAKEDEVCDHMNGDRLDNRRSNLRIVTKFENARNKVSGYGYLGVFPIGSKWGARLVRLGKTYYLGSFSEKDMAAFVVDLARIEFDGHIPRPNVPGFVIDDETKAELKLQVRIALDDNKSLTRAQITRIVKSWRSDRYWAKQFGVKQGVVAAARKQHGAAKQDTHQSHTQQCLEVDRRCVE